MNLKEALEQRVVRGILNELLDRLENYPDRVRSPSIVLDAKRVSEFGPDRQAGAADPIWDSLRRIHQEELIRLEYTERPRFGKEAYECNPRVRFVSEAEDRIRDLLGRPKRGPGKTALWRAAIERAFPGEPQLWETLANKCIEIEGRTADEIAQRLLLMRSMHPDNFLRHVSAKLFWADSKVLDNRQDLIAAVMGTDECPFRESPIQMQVHIEGDRFEQVLFVENVATFEAMRVAARSRSGILREYHIPMAIAQAYGFRGAAKRVRKRSGCSVYPAAGTSAMAEELFLNWLYEATTDPRTFFWGDLDYASMRIIRALRAVFPGLEAWQPGYGLLVAEIEQQQAHFATAASNSKENQRDPGETGCNYTDMVLLPAIRSYHRFVDQEIVLVERQ